MKRLSCLLMSLMVILALCGCQDEDVTQTTRETVAESSAQTSETMETHTQETEPATTAPSLPQHSKLYLPEVSPEEMQSYFNEVVLDMEYTDGDGDVTLVQKWLEPIVYQITGDPTDADLQVLNDFFAQLNEVEGFPGIYEAEQDADTNLTITFLDRDTFRLAFSDFLRGEEADGAVQFWYYTASNDIYTGRIGYRTDISQEVRNSVILEEIVNLLGLNDTELREDSIIYQYSSEATQLSEIDWILLKLLYHPDIHCGMDREACKAVLEKLYY